jgi:hypothetical protein
LIFSGCVSSRVDRTDGLCVPDPDGDPGAVRGRVPPPARPFAVHVRPSAHLRVADRVVLCSVQPAALLRGGARRRHAALEQRHRLRGERLDAAQRPPLHHHLRQLVLPAGHVLCTLPRFGHF